MTIRILVASEPGNAGVKRHVVDTLKAIDTDRFCICFAYSLDRADANYEAEIASIRQRGVDCYEVPMTRSISPIADLRSYFKMAKLVREFKPHVVHAHSAKAGFLARKAAKPLPLAPVGHRAVTVYTPNAMPCYRSSFYHRLEKFAANWTDWILAVTPSEKRDIVRWGIMPEDKVQVVPMSVPKQSLANSSSRVLSRPFVAGGCGRICDQKNTLLFFHAGERMLAADKESRLVWIGDYSGDKHSEEVEKLVANSPYSDRMEITGWLSDPLEAMQQLSVFCMFSEYESFGFVTADAMAMGIPVIGTKTTGTIDLVQHERTGLLIEGNPAEAHFALERLKNDPVLCEKLSSAAQDFVQANYAPEKCIAQLEEFYESVASKDDGRSP